MKILLTNDDGIFAPGLVALYEALHKTHDILVVAPSDERSASGHSITVREHLQVKKVNRKGKFYGFSVCGTPADCVKVALCELMDQMPDLVLSGINPGPNTGISVFYSGTISAAREAVISGVPAVALSVNSRDIKDFSYSAQFSRKLVRALSGTKLPPYVMLNVNIPAVKKQCVKGVKITHQAHSRFAEEFELVRKKGKTFHYLLTGEMEMIHATGESDEEALRDHFISITPLKLDLTDEGSMRKLKGLIGKVSGI